MEETEQNKSCIYRNNKEKCPLYNDLIKKNNGFTNKHCLNKDDETCPSYLEYKEVIIKDDKSTEDQLEKFCGIEELSTIDEVAKLVNYHITLGKLTDKKLNDLLSEHYSDDEIVEGKRKYKENQKSPKDKKDKVDPIELKMLEYVTKSNEFFKNIKRTYKSIYGNEKAIEKTKLYHELRRANEKAGMSYLKAVCFHGPTRSGKGTLEKAIITEELNPKTDIVIIVKSSGVISGDLSKSAKNIEDLLIIARKMRDKYNRSIHIFLDEADKKMPGRKTSSHNQGVMGGSWLEEMDGIENNYRIYFNIFTNELSSFDYAMINHGRISLVIITELPHKNALIRAYKDILKIEVGESYETIIPNIDYDKIADMTYGQSIAFVEDVCKTTGAMIRAGYSMINTFFYNEIQNTINEDNRNKSIMGIKEKVDDTTIDLIKETMNTFKKGKTEWEGKIITLLKEFKIISPTLDINEVWLGKRLKELKEYFKTKGITYIEDFKESTHTKKLIFNEEQTQQQETSTISTTVVNDESKLEKIFGRNKE